MFLPAYAGRNIGFTYLVLIEVLLYTLREMVYKGVDKL